MRNDDLPATGSYGCRQLRMGDVDVTAVSVVKSPYLSLISLLSSTRCPSRLTLAMRTSVSDPGRFALPALLGPSPQIIPDLVMSPNPPLRDTSIAEELESLLDHHPSEVQADLENAFGSRLPTWWRPAAQEPRRWIEAFAAASKEAGYVFSTVWNDAQSLLEREIARIGVAVVRNALDVLLNSLHPRIRYHQGAIQVGEPGGTETDLGTRRLVLVPMVSPRSATAISFDMPDVAYIGYPVPALTAKGIMTSAAYPNTDSDPLVVVLGSLRAQLLRSTESPLTMGQLASRLDRTPRTVTYHCDWLEEAGLVTRERRGQAVVLSRTPRGDELVGLLGG